MTPFVAVSGLLRDGDSLKNASDVIRALEDFTANIERDAAVLIATQMVQSAIRALAKNYPEVDFGDVFKAIQNMTP